MGLESLPFAAVHEPLSWHETDMPTALRDVRSQEEEQSGKHLLTVSSSQFDPNRTLAGHPAALSRNSHRRFEACVDCLFLLR